jgi:hypothetical protein
MAASGSGRQRRRVVYGALTMAVTLLERVAGLGGQEQQNRLPARKDLADIVYLPDAAAATDAADLIAQFGDHAMLEAAARANRSRGLGNVVHFCRWRQIERMIALLTATDRGSATVH